MYYIQYSKQQGKNVVVVYYMELIAEAIRRVGGEVQEVIGCPQKINRDDTIVTLSTMDFFKSYLKHPKNTICWIQGISPEENRMRSDFFSKYIVATIRTFTERFTLKKCNLLLFVSKGMLNHYRKKYGYNRDNYIVMPCLNEDSIFENAFTDEKYFNPTFLYSGDIVVWQCVEEMIQLFKQIKQRIPNAELKIYSRHQDEAKRLLVKHGVDAFVSFTTKEQLSEAIKGIKYGFIIRKNVAVNNVASPTKMSTYMANGIIPIFSKCIGDYNEQIGHLRYSVPLGDNYEGIEKLFELERDSISAKDVKYDCQSIFDTYYNSEKYLNTIVAKIKEVLS